MTTEPARRDDPDLDDDGAAPSRGFFFWSLAPVLLIFAGAMPMLASPPTRAGRLLLAGLAGGALLGVVGLWNPARHRWAFRAIGLMVFALAAWYLLDMLAGGGPAAAPRPAQPSVVNAVLFLVVFGLPGLGYAVFGRLGLRSGEAAPIVLVARQDPRAPLAASFGGEPYAAMLWETDPERADADRHPLAEALVATGCRYVCCGGVGGSAWDDAIDSAHLETDPDFDPPEATHVMTTWHDDEPMEEVAWYLLALTRIDGTAPRRFLALLLDDDDDDALLRSLAEAIEREGGRAIDVARLAERRGWRRFMPIGGSSR